jgi:hypothetical protein
MEALQVSSDINVQHIPLLQGPAVRDTCRSSSNTGPPRVGDCQLSFSIKAVYDHMSQHLQFTLFVRQEKLAAAYKAPP